MYTYMCVFGHVRSIDWMEKLSIFFESIKRIKNRFEKKSINCEKYKNGETVETVGTQEFVIFFYCMNSRVRDLFLLHELNHQ